MRSETSLGTAHLIDPALEIERELREQELDQSFLEPLLSDPNLVVMSQVKVKFETTKRCGVFNAGDLVLRAGDRVVVETERGTSVATVVAPPVRGLLHRRSLKRVLRKVGEEDRRHHEHNLRKEQDAFRFCLERVRARNLPMKLVSVELLHSDNKAIFYFSSDGRVDFRGLVKDLAAALWTRIEMRQIGIRDEAKMVGGIGSCGRELCCSTWLADFTPVTIKMAKYQGLVLNPQKVSGLCGRLMCCLAYEYEHYVELRRKLPRLGSQVVTPLGVGRVKELNLLAKEVKVELPEGPQVFPADAVQPVAREVPAESD